MAELTPTQISWQIPDNTSAHRTNRFACAELTIRRGQPFKITVYFNRPVQQGERVAFIVETGKAPSESHNTRATFPVSNALAGGAWGAVQSASNGNCVTFSLVSPACAAIGRYKLYLQVACGNKVYAKFLGPFILLFNAWCTGDPVFIENEAERQEYVLNENGIIFVGNAKYIEARGWYFGQFQQNIMNVCLALMDLSLYHRQDPGGDTSRRSDPRYVGRVVSSMINANDNDNGVLEGKWNETFAHHENPSRWNGSVAILRQWVQNNYTSVKYGQCWVFAAVAGTVLRCLGIPTRLVTNFNSAHDSDGNLSIDKYYDPSGKPLKGQDSTWDYHVWNECWFVRQDLGSGYCGWQVVDSTPQEKSQGIYQCGPASVMAVKQGDVRLNYDTAFVFTEVNADINTYTVYPNGKRVRVYCDTSSIGTAISTKAVGSNHRVDITNTYKCPEGSAEERNVYRKACAQLSGGSPRREDASEAAPELITHPELYGKFKLLEPPVLGRDISLILSLTNTSTAPKTVTVNLSVSTVLYTRAAVREILKEATTVNLSSKEEKHLPLRITYGHYGASLTDDKKILVTALCDVLQGVKLLVEKAITLESPNVSITVPPHVAINKPTTVEISYSNPLPEPVAECVLLVTLMGQAVKINVADLAAGEQSKIFFEFTPRSAGAMQLHVDFSCDKFHHIKSFVLMNVAGAA